MRPVAYARVRSTSDALAAVASSPRAKYIAGGTNIVDLMIDVVETPEVLVDINALPYATITEHDGFLRIGALARMSDTADHPLVKRRAPLIAQALDASASPQLRNAATMGGNVLQRTRCAYFRDVSQPCNKRVAGSGCAALHGENRQHAILGGSDDCIATMPSDLAVALVAADAVLRIRDRSGAEHGLPIREFYRKPGATPQIETALRHGELIVAIDVPHAPVLERSHYLKVRDRQQYQFALTSAAVAIALDGGVVHEARLALGGVGTVPWRVAAAEATLIGKAPSREAFGHAADVALAGAIGRGGNDFKIPLARRTVVAAFDEVTA